MRTAWMTKNASNVPILLLVSHVLCAFCWMVFSISESDFAHSYLIAVPSVIGVALGTGMLLGWMVIRGQDPSLVRTSTSAHATHAVTTGTVSNDAGQYLLDRSIAKYDAPPNSTV